MGSCGANRRELEDQSAIKGKLEIKWDKTKLVSNLGRMLRLQREEEEGRREEEEEEEKESQERYGN